MKANIKGYFQICICVALKNTSRLKKSSTLANPLTEKPGYLFAIAKIRGEHVKRKEIVRKGPASLLKMSLWDSFQFLLV